MQGEVMSVDSLSVTLALPYEPRNLSERSYRLQRLGNTVTYQRSTEAITRLRMTAVGQLCGTQSSLNAASSGAPCATALGTPAAVIAASWVGPSQPGTQCDLEAAAATAAGETVELGSGAVASPPTPSCNGSQADAIAAALPEGSQSSMGLQALARQVPYHFAVSFHCLVLTGN